jgi:fluoride exporter
MASTTDTERGMTAPSFSTRDSELRQELTLAAAVFAGGCLGALARAALATELPDAAHGWPWGTFAANLIGTALLAYFATRMHGRLPPSTHRHGFVGTGVCGALTTFSTLQIEFVRLAHNGRPALAAAYLATTIVLGLLIMQIVTKLVRRARLA